MGRTTGIDYVQSTWNPWQGCHPVSAGCDNCYMYREKKHYGQNPSVVVRSSDKTFRAPLHWKEPRRIMVCSWSDFFIEEAEPWRAEALEIIEACPQHNFVIPTKRTHRMIECLYGETARWYLGSGDYIPNIWWLASVENQPAADERIPELLGLRKYADWPVLGVSYEPAIEQVEWRGKLSHWTNPDCTGSWFAPVPGKVQKRLIDWLIMGAESGSNARPMHPDWVRQTRDACIAAGVSFFLKQMMVDGKMVHLPEIDGQKWHQLPEVSR